MVFKSKLKASSNITLGRIDLGLRVTRFNNHSLAFRDFTSKNGQL